MEDDVRVERQRKGGKGKRRRKRREVEEQTGNVLTPEYS